MIDLHAGDCRTILASLPDASVDAVVTDPPYELGFMGKKWDGTGIAYDVAMWAEVLRVLKPGGHLLSFGGTRTWHRMACAVEDAGFEMRDSIAWLYGSGFPKSLDVGKAINKAAGAERERSAVGATACPDFPADCGGHPSANGSLGGGVMRHAFPTAPATPDAAKWDGWGTALKPAHEPIVVARKPFAGTVAANVVAHGTGALNIDACRIGTSGATKAVKRTGIRFAIGETTGARNQIEAVDLGRWPANVVLDDTTAAILDEQSGTLTTGAMNGNRNAPKFGGAAASTYSGGTFTGEEKARPGDSGGASRFFYCAKAPTKERPRHDDGTAHPTVKPLTLMRWLVRLVTPPGGTVLDPFTGSGTTLEAALLEGFHAIGIEANEDYLPLILQRLARHESTLFGATA